MTTSPFFFSLEKIETEAVGESGVSGAKLYTYEEPLPQIWVKNLTFPKIDETLSLFVMSTC